MKILDKLRILHMILKLTIGILDKSKAEKMFMKPRLLLVSVKANDILVTFAGLFSV
ncbi:MAG: hypothetical protein IJU48_00910 [Synergistaceae bacterium]|nr:hypothetical protein [Synergistaceae bacterium]